MTDDLQNRLDSVCRKAIVLTERYKALEEAKSRADARIATLEKQLSEARDKIESLESQAKYLTLIQAVNPSRDDVERSRKVISELVRQIDRCINELND